MPKSLIKSCIYLCLSSLLIFAVAGCKKDTPKSQSDTPKTIEPATVRLQLVSPQMSLAGLFAAMQQGYFNAQKLTVEPIFGNVADTPDTLTVVNQVVAGEADFGLTSGDSLLQARERGDDLVGLMAFYQRDPTAVVSLANKNITRPEDLVGKKLLVFGRNITLSLFFAAVNIDPSQVTLVEPPDGNINAGLALFLSGQVDGMVVTGTDASAQMKAIGIEHNLIYFNDYGVQMYPHVLFTTRNMIETQPDVVQRFVTALLEGLNYAVSQPDDVATWFVENYGDQMRPDQLNSQGDVMLAIIPLIKTSSSEPGTMSQDVWQYVADGMFSTGLVDHEINYTEAFTTRFVDAYYKK